MQIIIAVATPCNAATILKLTPTKESIIETKYNTATATASAIYNYGKVRLGDVTLEENNSKTYIAILNQGSVEIYGNAFIADGQRIFLGTYLSETVKIVDGKKETVTERKFHEITISKENWLNKKADSEEVNHVEIDFVTKNAVMNKPVVQFASVMENGEENKSKLYNAYKQYLQDGN